MTVSSVIPAHRLRQEDWNFQASLIYTERSCLKKINIKKFHKHCPVSLGDRPMGGEPFCAPMGALPPKDVSCGVSSWHSGVPTAPTSSPAASSPVLWHITSQMHSSSPLLVVFLLPLSQSSLREGRDAWHSHKLLTTSNSQSRASKAL